jgi:hypothetical protein
VPGFANYVGQDFVAVIAAPPARASFPGCVSGLAIHTLMRNRVRMTETASSRTIILGAALLGAGLLGTAMALFAATPGQAQQPRYSSDWKQPPATTSETAAPARAEAIDALLKELGKLTGDAARQRAADPRFIADLNDLMRRYAWPWNQLVVSDDFRDGDYRRNPAWRVTSGAFTVGPRGLTARYAAPPPVAPPQQPAPQAEQGNQDLGAVLFGTVLRELSRNRRQPESQPAAPAAPAVTQAAGDAIIVLERAIPNKFAARVMFQSSAFQSSSTSGGNLEFGLGQGSAALGYFLKLTSGASPALSLSRRGSRGSAVIESAHLTNSLDDGKTHTLLLTRDATGDMNVTLDGKTQLRVVDRAFRSAFDRFVITTTPNNGTPGSAGDYAIRSVALYGAP